MGRRKVFNLDQAIDKLFKNYTAVLKEAMIDATRKARFDINFMAKSCLYEYYDSYDPIWYDRTDSLKKAFVPYGKMGENSNVIRVQVGVEYHPENLDGLYHGSKKWKNVDGSWVLNNYLDGLHPIGENMFLSDPISPSEKMNVFLNNYTKTFNENVLMSFARQLQNIKL